MNIIKLTDWELDCVQEIRLEMKLMMNDLKANPTKLIPADIVHGLLELQEGLLNIIQSNSRKESE